MVLRCDKEMQQKYISILILKRYFFRQSLIVINWCSLHTFREDCLKNSFLF